MEGFSEEVTFEQRPKGSEEGAVWIPAERVVQAEATAYAKALRH